MSSAFDRIYQDKKMHRLLEVISKALQIKQHEAEALSLLNNINTLVESQALKLENMDLRKNLNVEDFTF